jgi:hypothetical protein
VEISGTVIIMGVLGVLGREVYNEVNRKFNLYDEHLEECNKKAVKTATLEGQVTALDDKVCSMSAQMTRMDDKLDRLLER